MDIALNYLECGNGENLIMLHGNGEDNSYFEHQIEFFSNFFRVIALDTRGHGRSPRGDGEFTLDRFANDLFLFMREKGIEKANILGFSDGANIAILFALSHPDMVNKLVLNGGNIFPMGLKPKVLNEIISDWNRAKKNIHLKREEELLALMVKEPKLTWDDLKAIDAESLVIAGTNDMIRRKHSEKIAESIRHAKFVEIPGGHDIAYSQSWDFNKEVFDFLTQNYG